MASALGPPAKRRRLGPAEWDESDDDDELSFHPDEASARKDPEYRLSMHRAQAEHKLQSTMESIFDKYSRDFEGIGDEIDMVTGEIVVNNGHLSHLEDGEDPIMSAHRTAEGSDEDEEDRIMNGRGSYPSSTALVPARGPGPLRNQDPLPSRFPHPQVGAPFGFGPPAMPFDASPFGFGASPLAMGPWGPPGDFGQPPRFEAGFGALGGTYDFPIRDNYMSPNMPPLPATRTTKTILGPWRKAILAGPRKDREDDEEDDDTILTGKRRKGGQDGRANSASEDDDDLLLGGPDHRITSPNTTRGLRTEQAMASSAMSSARGTAGKKKSRRRTSEQRGSSDAAIAKTSPHAGARAAPKQGQKQVVATKRLTWPGWDDDDSDAADRRRSGRTRKKVEYMGKISWADALTNGKPQKMTVQLPPLSAGRPEDYEQIDEAIGGEADSSSARQRSTTPIVGRIQADEHRLKGVIPDSQDSSTPPTSSAPRQGDSGGHSKPGNQAKRREDSQIDVDSACFLSDEEAPAMIWRPLTVKKNTRSRGSNRSRGRPKHPETEDVTDQSELPEQATADFAGTRRAEEGSRASSVTLQEESCEPGDNRLKEAPAEKPRQLAREVQRLQKLAASSSDVQEALSELDSSEPRVTRKQLRSGKSRHLAEETARDDGALGQGPSDAEPSDQPAAAETAGQAEGDPYDLPGGDSEPLLPSPAPSKSRSIHSRESPNRTPSKTTPRKPNNTPSKPHTPRHSILPPATQAPSSRRSVLSLLSDDDNGDELGRDAAAHRHQKPPPHSAGPATTTTTTKRLWKATPRTTEVYHTPVKKRSEAPASPGSVVKTPGGTLRTCGVDSYRCGRDFCFTCL